MAYTTPHKPRVRGLAVLSTPPQFVRRYASAGRNVVKRESSAISAISAVNDYVLIYKDRK